MMFYRLKCAFDGTSFQLSQCTIISFTALYIVWTIETILAFAGLADPLYAISFLLSAFVIFILGFLFIYKLSVVNRRSGSNANGSLAMISFITKVALLTALSIASMMIIFVLIVVYLALEIVIVESVVGLFLLGMAVNLDIFTNFVSVILTYNRFERVYSKVCGCCDTICKILCKKMMSKGEIEKENEVSKQEVESHSPSFVSNTMDTEKETTIEI